MDDLFMRVAKRRRRGEGGFTLIELLVVIAVLAVLAFIVIFNVTGVKNKGNAAACATDVKSVQTAVDSYINDGSKAGALTVGAPIPAGDWTDLVPNYLHTAPNVTGAPGFDATKGTECSTTDMSIAFANGVDAT